MTTFLERVAHSVSVLLERLSVCVFFFHLCFLGPNVGFDSSSVPFYLLFIRISKINRDFKEDDSNPSKRGRLSSTDREWVLLRVTHYLEVNNEE